MNIIDVKKKDKQTRIGIFSAAIVFTVVLMSLVIILDRRGIQSQQRLLAESIENQLISISVAARDIIDPDMIDSYNSTEDVAADMERFVAVRQELRDLAKSTGADFIYVLKYVDNEVHFVMDTDEEDESVFIPYKPADVHLAAFAGETASGVMNVVDEYGSYNTAAIPLYKDGKVIAVISADIEDKYYQSSIDTAKWNFIILIVALFIVLAGMIVVIFVLLHRISRMQNQLRFIAHHDTVTGLPNRQYLLDFLEVKTRDEEHAPFALVFIDLDNFKTINDTAGHDMGDEVLKKVGQFLESTGKWTHSFRPAAGHINIAARVGGDEFIQVADGIKTEEDAENLAKKLILDFSGDIFKEYRETYGLGLSIGIALYPMHTEAYHVLIKYADVAMYHAKHSGKNDYCIYRPELGAATDIR